jgi:ankyrin repeat protein
MARLRWTGIILTLFLASCSAPKPPSVSLYLAVQRGDLDQIERHIHWDSDINQLGPDGQRPLHVAAGLGRLVITRLLLDSGADVDARNAAGQTPLERAVLQGRIQVATILREADADFDPDSLLLQAAAAGTTDRDVVRYLADEGASLEARTADGDTPLLLAVRQGNHRLTRHLIDAGADVNAENRGETALAIAQAGNFGDIARLLERHGAVATVN